MTQPVIRRASLEGNVVIRRAGPDDAAALSLIGRATLIETYAALVGFADLLAFARGGHSEERYAAFVADPACAAWLAEVPDTGVPIGLLLLTPPDLPIETGPGDVELRRIYTLSRYQGAGLGRRLFEQAIHHARATGMRRVLLGVKADNHRAIGFYQAMGGEQVGTRQFQVGATLFDDLLFGFSV